jgi:hypothetical protein
LRGYRIGVANRSGRIVTASHARSSLGVGASRWCRLGLPELG